MACTIRPAVPADIPGINAIHAHYVLNTVITFVLEPNSDEATLENYRKVVETEGLPYLVAVAHNETNKVLGYAYVSTFRGIKPGYRHSLELSLFCSPDHVRQRVGSLLLERLVAILRDPAAWEGWYQGMRLLEYPPKQLIACMAIDVDMPGAGWKLRDWYVQRGFEQRGHLSDVGWKKGRWVDTLFLQLALR